MDLDAFAVAHADEWARLEQLSRRRRLDGAEADELVTLYQRAATHLSVVRSAAPDPALVSRLSGLVARARAAATGSHDPAWRDVSRFFLVSFPAALYRTRRWWVATAVVSIAVAVLVGAWVAGDPQVQASVAAPNEVKQLVEHDFASYYSEHAASGFAAKVWTNNAWVAAQCIAFGVLGLPVLWVLLQNALNVGLVGGLMAANDRLDLFFGLILPHGILELTAVFVAAGTGLRLFWAWVDPGPRPRLRALAEEGRAAAAVVIGLVVVLAVSGVIEAFVTPSGLPTWARIAIGVIAEALFLAYVVVLGRRAVLSGETGDVDDAARGDLALVTG
ncbi:MAG TPA: stage II sporulation protein M [Actinomycetales bacterium]|nr:stage II sporulation protein M [Actinomycetales bacterium]